MDRNEIVRIANSAVFSNVTQVDACKVLTQYCLEKGKPQRETSLFISQLMRNPLLLTSYFVTALDYYKKKYAVNTLLSAPVKSNIIGEDRKVLLIF